MADRTVQGNRDRGPLVALVVAQLAEVQEGLVGTAEESEHLVTVTITECIEGSHGHVIEPGECREVNAAIAAADPDREMLTAWLMATGYPDPIDAEERALDLIADMGAHREASRIAAGVAV